MQDAFVDVTFEVPLDELQLQADPSSFIFEKMRDAADKLCEEQGATLRTDRTPEMHIRRGAHQITHEDFMLCASRWAVVAPERALSG